MCNRGTRDPLLRTLLDRYHLHLLSLPRDGSAVGDLYLAEGARVSAPGNVRHLLEPELVLPAIRESEPMADIAGRTSRGVDAGIGLDLLSGFVSAVAGSAIAAKVRGAYETTTVRQLRFSFDRPQRDSLDILELGRVLTGHRLIEAHPLVTESTRFYLVTAVARAASLSVVADSESGHSVRVELEALNLTSATSNLSIERTAAWETRFIGTRPIAFGVELHEIRYDRTQRTLQLSVPSKPMRMRGSAAPAAVAALAQTIDSMTPAFIGGLEGEVLLCLDTL